MSATFVRPVIIKTARAIRQEAYQLGFDPFENIICLDRFWLGPCGWVKHVFGPPGQYPVPAVLSPIVTDFGSVGSLHGNYSLKLATMPEAGRITACIKRLTMRKFSGRVKAELWFTYKAPAEAYFRSLQLHFDIQDDSYRYWPAVRWLNYEGGVSQYKWQYNAGGIDPITVWTDVPGGAQRLCWNTPDKYNWHYMQLVVNLTKREYEYLICNDKKFDMSGLAPALTSPAPELRGLLNPILAVETDAAYRSYFYIDSFCLSVEEVVT